MMMGRLFLTLCVFLLIGQSIAKRPRHPKASGHAAHDLPAVAEETSEDEPQFGPQEEELRRAVLQGVDDDVIWKHHKHLAEMGYAIPAERMEEIVQQAIVDRENGVAADDEFHRLSMNRISESMEERHRELENELKMAPGVPSSKREEENPADLQIQYQKAVQLKRKGKAKRNAEEESVNSISAACDELIDQDVYTLTSPNYPNTYDPNLLCTYSINVPADNMLELEFTDFSVEYCAGCTCDSLTVFGIPHCGDALPGTNGIVKYTTDGIHQLIFQTDGNTQQRGFSVNIRRIPVVTTPQPYLCDFELDDCGYQQFSADAQDWIRLSGPTDSAGTGPSVDHTTGTALGYYIYTEGSTGVTGDDAAIGSTIFDASPAANCLRFWYHMYGANMGTLNVFINDNDLAPFREVFSATGDHGDVWLEAEVDFQVDGRYSVIFESNRGDGYQSDMAIDDVQLSWDTCNQGPPVIDCNGDFIWDFGIITSPGYPAPYPENIQCSYRIHIPDNSYAKIWYRDVAIELCSASCPCDRMITNGNAMCGTATNVTDYLYPEANGISEIIFQSDWSVEFTGFYAEITILPGRPLQEIPMFCDFESLNMCGFVQDGDDVFDWTRNMGRTPSSATGPEADHTFGDTVHAYMYIETSSPRVFGDRARLLTPTFSPTFSTLCVGYWYHMHGYDINTLVVRLVEYVDAPNNTRTSTLWFQNGEVGNTWVYNEESFYAGEFFQIAFDGVAGTSYDGDISIDDVSITEGRCPSTPTATPSSAPITPVPECNRYITDEIDQISSPNFPDGYPSNAYCNWTIIIPPSKYVAMYFNVFDLEYSGSGCVFDAVIIEGSRFCGSIPPGFNGTVYIVIEREVTIEFVSDSSVFGRGFHAWIFQYDKEVAELPFDCHFEASESCYLVQALRDDFDWTRHSGLTGSTSTGPSGDHTLGTGFYVYTEASNPRTLGDVARVFTLPFPPLAAGCAEFWYHMYGSGMGTLEVSLLYENSSTYSAPLLSVTGDQGDVWLKASVDITSPEFWRLVFDGVRGSGFEGDMALDDINIKDEACIPPDNCQIDEYECLDGTCIPSYYLCDQVVDCSGLEDELNCDYGTCGPNEFQCVTGACIFQRWYCDGVSDCKDNSDESNCPQPTQKP